MTAWQLPAISAAFSASTILALVYAYLYARRKEFCLGLWTAAWATYALRSGLILLAEARLGNDVVIVVARWTDVVTALLLLAGAATFYGRRTTYGPWIAAGCAAAGWYMAARLGGQSFLWQNLPLFLFQAVVYVRTGLLFLGGPRHGEGDVAATIVGGALVVWGLHKLNFPFLRHVEELASWGFLLAALLMLIIAIGTLLIYYERTEAALKRSELRLKRAQRMARLGHFEYEPDSGRLHCSDELCRIWGLPPDPAAVTLDQLVGAVHVEDRAAMQSWLAGARNAVRKRRFRIIRADGVLRWITIDAFCEAGGAGTLPCRYGICRDITERMQAEDELRRERDFAASILDTAEALIVVLDEDGRVLRFNKACERVTGFTADQVLNTPFWDRLVPPDHVEDVRSVFVNGRTDAPLHQFENDWRTAEGERRTIRWSNSWMPVHGSHIYGIGIGIDVTEHRRAEQALVDSEERYRSLVENAPNIVFTAQRDGTITFANAPAAQLGEGSIVGTSFFDHFHEHEVSTALGSVAEVLGTGLPAAFEARGRPRSDHAADIWYDVRIGPLRCDDRTTGFVAILTDVSERKRAEENLLVSRFAMDRAAHGVSLSQPDGRMIYMNEAGCRLLGYAAAEIVRLSVCELDSAVTADRWAALWDDLRRFGTVKLETALRTKDGRLVPIELVANHLDGPGGPLNCTFFQDISERRQAAEALAWEAGVNRTFAEISNHLLSQATMSVDDIAAAMLARGTELTGSRHGFVGHIDPHTGFLICPTFTASIWGECAVANRSATFERFTGLWGWALTHRQALLTNDPAADARSGSTPVGHLPIRRFLAAPALIDGDLLGLIAVANAERDYTDRDLQVVERLADMLALALRRRRTEDALRKLSRAVEQSPASVIVTDLDGRIEYVNPELLRKTGYTENELIGATPAIFKSGRATATEYKRLWQTISAGKVWRGELCNRKKDGELFWESASISPVRDERGRITHFVAVKEDITDRKRAVEDLHQAKRRAELADRAKSQFLANVSHELRTPLNAIIGFSEIMLGETFGAMGNPRYLGYAHDINSSGYHLLQIINDILDLSKIEADQLQLNEEVVDVCAVVRECLDMLKGRVREARLRLHTSLQADFPALHADRVALKRILINLLSNAIKFTPERGRISLSASADPADGAVLAVADTGIGIAADDIETVLQPFGQVESSMNRRHMGTGLGLPLTRSLVELHGGTLTIDSEVGAGTTVTVRLPACRLIRPH